MTESLEIAFRAATEQDVFGITKLLDQLNEWEGNATQMSAHLLARDMFTAHRKVDLKGLVAVAGDQVLGVILYYQGYDILTNVHGYHVGDVVVHKDYRGRGIGRRMMTLLGAQNLSEGGEWMALTVLKKNTSAQAFYRALEMTEVPVDFFAIGKINTQKLVDALSK